MVPILTKHQSLDQWFPYSHNNKAWVNGLHTHTTGKPGSMVSILIQQHHLRSMVSKLIQQQNPGQWFPYSYNSKTWVNGFHTYTTAASEVIGLHIHTTACLEVNDLHTNINTQVNGIHTHTTAISEVNIFHTHLTAIPRSMVSIATAIPRSIVFIATAYEANGLHSHTTAIPKSMVFILIQQRHPSQWSSYSYNSNTEINGLHSSRNT